MRWPLKAWRTILAEPNLTATSGESANFLAGGEFPMPILNNNTSGVSTYTIDYKQFGILLNITPTILDDGRINLKVTPEVSMLDFDTQINAQAINLPSLRTRRVDTTVELASGESFVLGGLLHQQDATEINKMPFLGDVPILGTLFRSTTFQRQESELVVIATAYLVEPGQENDYQTPLDNYRPATALERLLFGSLRSDKPEETPHTPRQNATFDGRQRLLLLSSIMIRTLISLMMIGLLSLPGLVQAKQLDVSAKLITVNSELSQRGLALDDIAAIKNALRAKAQPQNVTAVITLHIDDVGHHLTAIRQDLASIGIQARFQRFITETQAPAKSGFAHIALEYYQTTVNACEKGQSYEFSCATSNNLAAMVANPRHLIQGERPSPASGLSSVTGHQTSDA